MQITPSPFLSNHIKHYLVLDIESDIQKNFRHFSNGHNGIVFAIKKTNFKVSSTNSTLPNNYVFGQILNNQDFIMEGALSIIIVLFQPFGLYRFTGIPSNELKGKIVDASLIFDNEVFELNERLRSECTINTIVENLNSFFLNRLNKNEDSLAPFLQNTVQHVLIKKGMVSVKQLSLYACTSERNLQRTFAGQIGISPKKFIQIIKLHSFLGLMGRKSSPDLLTRISLQAGFYDQAHLIREFKELTGLTQSAYRNAVPLAVNLISL